MLDGASRAQMAEERPYQTNLVSLQTEVLDRLVAATLLASLFWFLFIGLADTAVEWRVVFLPLLLAASALLAYSLSRAASLRLASVSYLAGVSLVILLMTSTYHDASLLVFLALIAGAASLLLGAAVGFLAAALIGLGLAATEALQLSTTPPSEVVRQTIILTLLITTLLWVALYPLRTTLAWAWQSYEREREQTEAARTHRGELARALANLDIAYRRLEVMNVDFERTRQAAVEARRLKAEFAANISHELRTPLNLIIGFSEMMIMAPQSYDSQPLPAAYRGDLQSIHRNAKHLSQLVDDVLDLSQVEAARMGLVREPASVAEVVDEATAAVAQMFKSKHLELVSHVSADLPPAEMDRTRVRQVLINLLNNAGRFTDQGGVTITADQKDGDLIVAVADTGIGISEQGLTKIFEEFRQLDGSIRRRVGGSGLGLAISRKLIELHGGRMWATSQVGVGTTIYFSVPLQEDVVIPRGHREWDLGPHVGAPLPRRDSVILVAKEPRTVSLFQRYLDNYRVLAAPDMDEAVQLSQQEPVRALINTVQPGALGWLDPKSIASNGHVVPVLAVALRGHTLSVQDMAVTSYLTKPVLQDQFLAVLRELGEDIHDLLIVDDDHDTVRLLSRMARLAGPKYRITRAFDGQQALEIMGRRRPDAVILDLLMPGVDGYSVLEAMRSSARLKDVPVIVATARGREQETITADAVGIMRGDGFSVAEAMRCLKAALDTL